jgi:beta-glucosidase
MTALSRSSLSVFVSPWVSCAAASLVLGAGLAACAPEPAPAAPAGASAPSAAPAAPPSSPSLPAASLPPEKRAEELLARMTLEEKLAYIGGDRFFYIRPIPRLGIPEIKMSDGPVGCRTWGPTIAYPAAIGLAATFDVALAERVGRSIGRDCRARGVHVLLAPGVNIARSPLGGRNFEYLGEDPFLAGKTAAAFVRGVQAEGVLATVKHFAGNNQEWDRHHVSSEIDERALREIYFPAFERAVREGQAKAVMTSYNLLNGVYASQHPWLITTVLKTQWGFQGIVMSDWEALDDGAAAAKAGLDLEMPSGRYMNGINLSPLLAQHALDVALIDDKVRRILRTIIAAGFLDSTQRRDDIHLDDARDAATSLDEARRTIVLLKNVGSLLPLDRTKIKRIAVIGPNAMPAVIGGAGSAYPSPSVHAVSPLEGIGQGAGGIEVDYHPGVRQVANDAGPSAFEGADGVSAIAKHADVVVLSLGFGQGAETNSAHKPFQGFWPEKWARQAGLVESEDSDRPFDLPPAQIETVRLALAANPRAVVVVNAGGAVDVSRFIDKAPALLWAWYGGEDSGRALADVLFGEVNPSAKLPVTFAKRYADYPSAPYYNVRDGNKTPYTEGIFVGYRGFDARKVEPAFPFGFGLSYTRYEYSDLRAAAQPDGSARVAVKVTNRGKRAGEETVEIYVAPPPSPDRPPRELKGYARVALEPGETKEVTVDLEPRAFAFWDTKTKQWTVAPGAYDILAAASDADLRAKKTVEVAARVLPL